MIISVSFRDQKESISPLILRFDPEHKVFPHNNGLFSILNNIPKLLRNPSTGKVTKISIINMPILLLHENVEGHANIQNIQLGLMHIVRGRSWHIHHIKKRIKLIGLSIQKLWHKIHPFSDIGSPKCINCTGDYIKRAIFCQIIY